jgi:hypothetical protein
MTSKEEAELHFKCKQNQMADTPLAKAEYEQRAQAERDKMVRLRALRLARDARIVGGVKRPAG